MQRFRLLHHWRRSFFFDKKWANCWPLFVYFRHVLMTITIRQIDKSIEGLLGIWTRGHRIVGADETTELWRPPSAVPSFERVRWCQSRNYFSAERSALDRAWKTGFLGCLTFLPFKEIFSSQPSYEYNWLVTAKTCIAWTHFLCWSLLKSDPPQRFSN